MTLLICTMNHEMREAKQKVQDTTYTHKRFVQTCLSNVNVKICMYLLELVFTVLSISISPLFQRLHASFGGKRKFVLRQL